MSACPEYLSFTHTPYKAGNYNSAYTKVLLTRLAKISLVGKKKSAIWKMVLNVALWQNESIRRVLMNYYLRNWEQRKI